MIERTRKMIEQALDGATWSMEEIAAAAGVSVNSLYAWKVGRRSPTPKNLARLADALESRRGELKALAAKLRKAAGE